MSKAHKSERQKQKAKERAARKALYASEASAGKAKRLENAMRRWNPYKHAHRVVDCGNAGCVRCNPRIRHGG